MPAAGRTGGENWVPVLFTGSSGIPLLGGVRCNAGRDYPKSWICVLADRKKFRRNRAVIQAGMSAFAISARRPACDVNDRLQINAAAAHDGVVHDESSGQRTRRTLRSA